MSKVDKTTFIDTTPSINEQYLEITLVLLDFYVTTSAVGLIFPKMILYVYIIHHLFLQQLYPKAVVGTAGRGVIIYNLENTPTEFKRFESPLKYQVIIVIDTLCH